MVKQEKNRFSVKKNVQIFCSAGILRWRGDAHRSRMEKHWWQTSFWRYSQLIGTFHSCSSCSFEAHLPAQVQLQLLLLPQFALKGTVDTRGSPSVQNHPWESFTHASQHPQSSPTILCTPRSAGLVTTAAVASLCSWNDPGDAEEADLRDLAPPAMEMPWCWSRGGRG